MDYPDTQKVLRQGEVQTIQDKPALSGSVKGLQRNSGLLDHLVRVREHVRRDRDPNLSCYLEVDDQLGLLDALNWQVARSRSLEDLIHHPRHAPCRGGKARAVGKHWS